MKAAFMRLTVGRMVLGATAVGLGCGRGAIRVASVDEVERVRATPAVQSTTGRATEVSARAERERELARSAHASGDDVAANLHAEWAIAAYGHAFSITRRSIAIAELADAQKALDDATAQEQSLAASRASLEREVEELERRALSARERLLPASRRDASDVREGARPSVARSLAVEARLLCGAALLVAADAVGLAEAEGEVAKLDDGLAKLPHSRRESSDYPGDRVIDEAGAARAHCLAVLTRARRAAGDDGGRDDALLSELSASGGWDPTRDERGIVVTLRGAFQGPRLTSDGEAKLLTLGRIASSHPHFAVQVVLHDAEIPSAKDDGDAQRTGATVKALLAGGAPAARVKAELAGTEAPVVDPNDAKVRIRNERLDIVFVAGS